MALLAAAGFLLPVCRAASAAPPGRQGGLLGSVEAAGLAAIPDPGLSAVSLLKAPLQIPAESGESMSDGRELFRTPPPEKMYKPYPKQKFDYFSETFRIGISTGLLIPLIANESGYEFGWWSRLTLHREFDLLGLGLFRTMAELSAELGQSSSSPDDQAWRIVSTLYFFRLRAMADFLPEQTGDLYIFGGVGLGFERARGHQLGPSGYKKIRELNMSPLLEAGAGVSVAVSRGFMLDFRASTTWPVTSGNILLYLNIEFGAFFLFM